MPKVYILEYSDLATQPEVSDGIYKFFYKYMLTPAGAS